MCHVQILSTSAERNHIIEAGGNQDREQRILKKREVKKRDAKMARNVYTYTLLRSSRRSANGKPDEWRIGS
jgi:CobQ-like glutamine amidotransferase family enzyme